MLFFYSYKEYVEKTVFVSDDAQDTYLVVTSFIKLYDIFPMGAQIVTLRSLQKKNKNKPIYFLERLLSCVCLLPGGVYVMRKVFLDLIPRLHGFRRVLPSELMQPENRWILEGMEEFEKIQQKGRQKEESVFRYFLFGMFAVLLLVLLWIKLHP